MPLIIVTKFDEDRGHNSEVPWTIWLVIEFDRDTMPISLVTTKLNEDRVRIS